MNRLVSLHAQEYRWLMSEYIEIEHESGDDPDVMMIYTNVTLAEGAPEQYATLEEMEEGSPVAQAIAYIEGVSALRLEGKTMTVTREPEMPWHIIVAEISTAIRSFFL